jgi:hypothetical protein
MYEACHLLHYKNSSTYLSFSTFFFVQNINLSFGKITKQKEDSQIPFGPS